MAKFVHLQSDFSAGEISPKLFGRTDLKAYDQAAKTITNAYPLPYGGLRRRPGTLFVGEVPSPTQAVKLIPFVYSRDRSFVVVFNGSSIQFLNNGDWIRSGGTPYGIGNPYTAAELPDVKYAQSGNVLFLAHPNHPPMVLRRTTDTNWSISNITFVNNAVTDYWYENYAIRFKLYSGSTTFVAGDGFVVVVDGSGNIASVNPKAGGNTGTGYITGVSSKPGAAAETWTITCTLSTTTRQEWTVTGSVSGICSATWHTNDYPAAVSFFEQRLFFAGSPSHPQTVWGSAIADYTNFTLGPNDGDAVSFTIAANRYDQIIHLEAARQLLPFTYGGEFTMAGSTSGITPTAVRMRSETSYGSSNVKPIRIGQEVLFLQRDRKHLRAVSYSVTEDANVAPDITIFSEHITEGGIVDMSFAQDPDFITWLCRADGVIVTLTHMREQAITAWAKHATDGYFENVCSIPESFKDGVYVAVRRTINGVTKRYIEKIDYDFDTFLDCASFGSDATGKTTWTGLSYLEGKSVWVIADGQVHQPVTVTSGAITLQYPAKEVTVGLNYTTTVDLLTPEVSMADGSSQGRALSISEITLRFLDTVGCRVEGNDLPFRKAGDPADSPIPPFTGDKKVAALGWKTPYSIKIEQPYPQAFTLLGVILKVALEDQ